MVQAVILQAMLAVFGRSGLAMSQSREDGIVMGARVPIILTSRADSAEARMASCAVAAAFAHWLRKK